ncbi:MAG: cytochrome c [Alphaproteobacteria bacterium]|nr:cytochrome c [Alphaproteobacteria bacterium]
MFMRKIALAAVAAAALTVSAAPAMADDAGEIEYRKAVMEAIGGHTKALFGIINGRTGNNAHLASHAAALADLSQTAAGIFPEGSDFGDTAALPAIWEQPGEFEQAVKMFQDAAATLNTAAQSGDMSAIGQAAGGLGKSCKNCHAGFRQKGNR